jgi:hypothetical protein
MAGRNALSIRQFHEEVFRSSVTIDDVVHLTSFVNWRDTITQFCSSIKGITGPRQWKLSRDPDTQRMIMQFRRSPICDDGELPEFESYLLKLIGDDVCVFNQCL